MLLTPLAVNMNVRAPQVTTRGGGSNGGIHTVDTKSPASVEVNLHQGFSPLTQA